MSAKQAVFLDRDGTLNFDPGYLHDFRQLRLLPDVGPALGQLKKAGFTLVVVSNQSGIARGLIQPPELEAVHTRLNELLGPYSAQIDHFECCTHHPRDNCPCRKPSPELLHRAAHKLNLCLARSCMVGDRLTDLEAGKRAHCRQSLIIAQVQPEGVDPADWAQTLGEAVERIIESQNLED